MNLISKELIAKVANDSKLASTQMNPYTFPAYTNVCIGVIHIIRGGNETYIHLSENVSKQYMKVWSKDVGKILSNDLRKNRDELYFEMVTDTYRVLLRKITEEELGEMTERGFNHVLIGDFYYVIIKEIPLEGSYGVDNMIVGKELLVDPMTSSTSEEEDAEEEKDVEEEEEDPIESLSLF